MWFSQANDAANRKQRVCCQGELPSPFSEHPPALSCEQGYNLDAWGHANFKSRTFLPAKTKLGDEIMSLTSRLC